MSLRGKPTPVAVGALVGALAAATLLAAPTSAAAERYVAGSPGLGDPFFPRAGNGGYDVERYLIDLTYRPAANRLRGAVVVRARATQNLRRFNLDLRGYRIRELAIGGRTAPFRRRGQELIVSPRPRLRRGSGFSVRVVYAGHPEPVIDPDGTSEGWTPTDDGAYVVNEPQGSPSWYPVNDNPRDKALYAFSITVPAGHTAVANGRLVSQRTAHGETTWRWRTGSPMAPYLATATNGPFETRFAGVAKGLPEYNAVDPDSEFDGRPDPDLAWARLGRQRQIVRFFARAFGPYPFDSSGGVVDHAPEVGYALESQTRSMYSDVPSRSTVVHEVAHQWFGNSVTLSVWPDIWLNEGFATWSEWFWIERHGGPSAAETFEELLSIPEDGPEGRQLWSPAPRALPGPEQLFSRPVYDRGAMTLQALREKIGHRAFIRLLRRWYRQNRDGNVRTAGFVRLAEHVAGQPLDRFFRIWLSQNGKPEDW